MSDERGICMHQRKFIFLEDIDNYSAKSNNLKGHAQFSEMKNKVVIKLFIEGLPKEEYGVDLLLEESSSINIGNFYGQNNSEKIFHVNNSIKEINAVLIYPITNKKNLVLVGYLKDKSKVNIKEIGSLQKENLQKENLQVKEKHIEKYVETITNKKEITANKKEEHILPDIENEQKEDVTSKNDHGDQELEKESNKNEEINQQETKVIDPEKVQVNIDNHTDIESDTEPNIDNRTDVKSNIETRGAVYNNQIFYLWENLDKLDSSLKPANPFIQPIPKHKWWQVKEYDSQIQYYCILYNGYLMPMIYPFMNYKNLSMVEKEWVFGTVTENYEDKEVLKYFVYGIPGKFYMQEQPFKGSTGYLYWQSSDVISKDPMGYWLLYVDVHTGKIVIPRRPVKPPLNKSIMHNNI